MDPNIVDIPLVEGLGFIWLELRHDAGEVRVVVSKCLPHLLLESAGTVAAVAAVLVGHGDNLNVWFVSSLLFATIQQKLDMDSAIAFRIWQQGIEK